MIRTIALFLALSLQVLPAFADRVTLVNGDRLTGTVRHFSADALTLETRYAGTLEIERSQIATLQTDQAVPLMLEGEPGVQQARIVGGSAGRAAIERAPDGAAESVALERIARIHPKPEESGIGVSYRRRVTVSAAHTRGNSSNSRRYAEADFRARAKAYRYALGFKGTHSSDSGADVASNWLANGNYDWFVSEDRFYYARAALERDRFRAIDLRSSIGGGAGLQLYDTERTQVSLRGGVDAVMLERTDSTRTRYPALGWGVSASHWLLPRRLELFHDQDGFWNLERTGEVTLHSRTGVRVPIAKGLSASAQLNLDWEKTPAPGRTATDSTFLLGLDIGW